MERRCTGNSVLLCELRMLMSNTAVKLVSHYSLTEKSLCGRPKVFTTEIQNLQNKVYDNKQCSQEQHDSNSQTGRKYTSRRESVDNFLFKTGQNFP